MTMITSTSDAAATVAASEVVARSAGLALVITTGLPSAPAGTARLELLGYERAATVPTWVEPSIGNSTCTSSAVADSSSSNS